MKKYNVAVVGATGLIGSNILSILEERRFPINNIYPLTSEKSAGKSLVYAGEPVTAIDLADFDFSKADLALFSAGGAVSAKFVPAAVKAGCVVIDNTSHYRYEPDVPLVVSEVNPHALAGYKKRKIIANPNCSTMQMVVALKPIYDAVGIRRINVATYQSVSGAGRYALLELKEQTSRLLEGGKADPKIFRHQIAFNVLPQIAEFMENGYTKEEMKMVWETQKIFEDSSIMVNPTAVRVPVFFGHAEAIHIETRDKLTTANAHKLLENAPGIKLIDDLINASYPTPSTDAAGKDLVYVGRIREDISHPLGLNLWVVADNVRKGGALNAVQIAEIMINKYL